MSEIRDYAPQYVTLDEFKEKKRPGRIPEYNMAL